MWAINTDAQALDLNMAHRKLNIGNKTIARGLGAGGDPLIGCKAAEESKDDISAMVKDAELIFITAGMGGGTGDIYEGDEGRYICALFLCAVRT